MIYASTRILSKIVGANNSYLLSQRLIFSAALTREILLLMSIIHTFYLKDSFFQLISPGKLFSYYPHKPCQGHIKKKQANQYTILQYQSSIHSHLKTIKNLNAIIYVIS